MLLTYTNSEIWDVFIRDSKSDLEKKSKERLETVFQKAWNNGCEVASKISCELPDLTLHNKEHFKALFRCASLLLGPEHDLNPFEVFIFGMSVLIHDIGHTSIVYEGGMDAIKETPEFKDFSQLYSGNESEEQNSLVLFQTLRSLHAKQAENVLRINYSSTSDDPIYILEDKDLRDAYSHVIGKIAASHHWNREIILSELAEKLSAPADFPSDWEIRPRLIAILLRCADAIQIDRSRAPLFSKSLLKPNGLSELHWNAQNKILAPVVSNSSRQTIEFSSTSLFDETEVADWWIAYDLCKVAHEELAGCKLLLRDLNYRSFTADRVYGASDPTLLCDTIKTQNWSPVNAEVKITDTQRIIELFGGQQLYTRSPIVPIREAIQNAADAIRAKQAILCARNDHEQKIRIEVNVNEKFAKFKISDTGIGMSKRILTGPLIEFGKSLWSSVDLQSEFPGLMSKKIKQSGRYGIGFFSYLMISDHVKVISRGLEESDAFSLELANGELRPVLRKVSPSELAKFATVVEFEYPVDDYKNLLTVRTELQRSEVKVSLQERISTLCAVLPYDVEVCENNKCEIVHQYNWYELENNDWLGDLSMSYKPFYEPDAQKKSVEFTSDLLSEFVYVDAPETIVGKAAIGVSNFNTGTNSIGGFCDDVPANYRQGFLGVLPLDPNGPSRTNGTVSITKPTLSEWASEQAKLISAKNLAVEYLLNVAIYICKFGGDPLPIAACVIDRNVVSLSEVVTELKNDNPVYFPVSYSERDNQLEIGKVMIKITNHSSLGVNLSDMSLTKKVVEAFGGGTGFKDYYLIKFREDHIEFDPNSLIGCINRQLSECEVDFEISFEQDVELGKYTGLSSEREKLKKGQFLYNDCLVIKPSVAKK